ncbi:hypothetical protein DDB_G0283523 [Dictyostelium discoideum AX4]|uniref:UPF0538 protein n=1 Tax=Dictyostelium discoideum TaxID=44689 RepID=U538_DICDI|nr:hypothetical protein DDB_G0283523 [Dictyostelium discoideum AX4]Q54R16.1 RecName: Full=UPF0538 protein [Dictyostelium discoideum]EAL65746.1 hypothetical protein DDB_G0283523 [Dictyostelium discoideum AX4]|eukprot:XP_639075.1 hypothetical protein DDB_G0283523 [Dictyostelium discoideum AX4]
MENENKILIIRVIRSFEYRTIKNLILKDIDLNTNVSDFKKLVADKIQTTPGFTPFKTKQYDSMKIFFVPHGQKPNNLTINIENDHFFLNNNKSLAENGVVYETEISFFVMEDYLKYKENPENKW